MRKKKSAEINKENSLIVQKEYHEEIEEDILNYSLSAIVRAIPDARDGLKPVHRRILYAMKTAHNTYDKPYRKSIKGVSETMGRFHPHGDASVYDAMVRLGQDFKMGMTLMDIHGNGGSIDGDPAAASRYTEMRLAKFAETLLEDIEKGVVPMADNFDGSEKEPLVLPSRIPNALINGNQGIATGIATNVPSHSLSESIDAFLYFIDHKKVTLDKILEIMPGPDFPTGGIIINKDELRNLYLTGQSRVITRAKIQIERNKKGKDSLIVTEIPYSMSGQKTKIIESINDLIINRKLPEVIEVRDESSKEGIRINIILKKEMTVKELNNLENKLFKLTPLESSETFSLMMTYNLRPKLFTLLEYFKVFHEFQKDITKKKYEYLLNKYSDRKEVLEGLIKAIDIIDLIVEVSRYSKNSKCIKACLTTGDTSGITFKTKSFESKAKKLRFTEKQALAIMAIRLEQLSGLEVLAFKKELTELDKKIETANKIISSETALNTEIKKYMTEIKKEFGRPRRTVITNQKQADFKEEKIIEDVVITIDKFGYLRLLSENNYSKLSGDELSNLTFDKKTNTEDKLFFFIKDGNAYSFKIEEIAKTKSASPRGILIDSLVESKNAKDTKPIFTCLESELKTMECLFVSSDGFIKRVKMDEFIVSKSILKATVLNDGAYVQLIENIKNKKQVVFTTSLDREVARPLSEINIYKKVSKGILALPHAKKNETMNTVKVI